MKEKLYTGISLILILLGISILFNEFYRYTNSSNELSSSSDEHELDELWMENQPEKNYINSKQADNKYVAEFRRISNEYPYETPIQIFRDYYDKIGPDTMLDAIEEDKFCHSKGHNLGRVIFEKTMDIAKSTLICKGRCSTGCFHGVLMGFFNQSISNEYEHVELEGIRDKVVHVCDIKKVKNQIGKGGCIHGLGHALLFLADYNISKSIEYCNLYNDTGPIYYCATGVFMERDISFGKLDKGQPNLYPCNMYNEFPAACYRYKLRREYPAGKTDFKKVAKICLELNNSNQRRGCFHGLGFGFSKPIFDNISKLPEICSYGDHIDQRMCIEGAIGMINVYDREVAVNACSSLGNDFKGICEAAIDISNFGMGRDFSLYYNKSINN